METGKKNYFKFTLALVLCLFARLIPFRAPNIEPILATTMPIGRAFGVLSGFSFAVLSILLYDLTTHTLGVQTIFTVVAYGILGLWSAVYFKKDRGNIKGYVSFAIMGTLFFDVLTGLTVGPIFFHQSFIQSLIGQIPFTALHLVGNVAFAIILSPAIYSLLIKKKTCLPVGRKKKILPPIIILNPKTI